MKSFEELITKRRSIRKFSDKLLDSTQVELVLKAALMAPTSKNLKHLEFIAIEEKAILEKLAYCKEFGSQAIGNCTLAVIVLANPIASDVWIEDASIATTMMMLQAEELNLGSCWIQIRERHTTSGISSEDFIKDIFDIPMHLQVHSIIALGCKEQEKLPFDEEKIEWEKIHINKY